MVDPVGARKILAEALGLPEEEIATSMTIETCPNWDSLAHMRVVRAVEGELNRPLEPEEIFSIGGVADVEKLLAGAR